MENGWREVALARRWVSAFAFSCLCAGCGSSEPAQAPPSRAEPAPSTTTDPAPPTTTEPAPPTTEPAQSVATSPAEPAPPPAVPADDAPVDLLHAVPTAVAVSSAYRDDVEQVSRLFDGDLETAWNSRPGDLAGAWIAFRLPDGASVTSIGLTAGFTKVTERADLFTGNHRIARVRVTRAGETLVEHALDVGSREVQSIPVEGGGGDYRIEIVEVAPGTREGWRETCVSELRVMGRAPDARPDRYRPLAAIGELPALPTAEESSGEDAEEEEPAEFRDALYLRLRNGELLIFEDDEPMGGYTGTFARDSNGRVWTCEEQRDRALILAPADVIPLPDGTRCGPMAATADGQAWVLANQSLAHWDGERWTVTPAGSIPRGLYVLAVDGEGTLWALAWAHVYRRRNGEFEEVPVPPRDGPQGHDLLAFGPHVILVHAGAGILRWDGQAFAATAVSEGRLGATALAADGTVATVQPESGSLFILARDAPPRRIALDSIEGRPMEVSHLAYDDSGRLWMWADSGLYVLGPDPTNVVRRYRPGSVENLTSPPLGSGLSAPVAAMLVRGQGPRLRANGTRLFHVRGRLVRGGRPLARTQLHFCTNPVRRMGSGDADPCERTASTDYGYSRSLRTRADGTFDVWEVPDGEPVNVVVRRSDGGWYYSPDRLCCERLRSGRTLDLGDLEIP